MHVGDCTATHLAECVHGATAEPVDGSLSQPLFAGQAPPKASVVQVTIAGEMEMLKLRIDRMNDKIPHGAERFLLHDGLFTLGARHAEVVKKPGNTCDYCGGSNVCSVVMTDAAVSSAMTISTVSAALALCICLGVFIGVWYM